MIVEEDKPFPFRHLHFWLDTFPFGSLFNTFTFGTFTFGSTLSLLEHFSTLSLLALALLAQHFRFWSTFQHFHFSNHRSFDTVKRQALSLSALTLLVQHFHFWDTF